MENNSSSSVSTETRRPNRHAAVIKAWADGAEVQYKGPNMTEWKDLLPAGESMTMWREDVEYRIKPAAISFFIGVLKPIGIFATHSLTRPGRNLNDLVEGFPLGSLSDCLQVKIDPTTHKIVYTSTLPIFD